MKKLGLFGGLALILVVIFAVTIAGKMGETSSAHARGKVMLSESVRVAAEGVRTLFIIVSGVDTPMPFAAMRVTLSGNLHDELYDFVLTNERVQKMRPEEPWPTQFKLKARLDRDGTAGPDQPGDLVGEIAVVQGGTEDLVLTIDRVIE